MRVTDFEAMVAGALVGREMGEGVERIRTKEGETGVLVVTTTEGEKFEIEIRKVG